MRSHVFQSNRTFCFRTLNVIFMDWSHYFINLCCLSWKGVLYQENVHSTSRVCTLLTDVTKTCASGLKNCLGPLPLYYTLNLVTLKHFIVTETWAEFSLFCISYRAIDLFSLYWMLLILCVWCVWQYLEECCVGDWLKFLFHIFRVSHLFWWCSMLLGVVTVKRWNLSMRKQLLFWKLRKWVEVPD